jgi:hypothetical protein
MDLLFRLAVIECGVLLLSFFGMVLWKIAVGEISLAGLLTTKEPGGGSTFSPARLQLLIFTVVVAGTYLHAALATPRPQALPTLPNSVIAVLGGSHAVYLGGKTLSTFIQPLLRNPR